MLESVVKLFVVVSIVFVSCAQQNVQITDEKQAAVLKASSEHHIVFPYRVDSNGNFLSHDIHHRNKRSSDATPDIHYHIPFNNERFHLELKPNDNLMISGLEVEWRSGKRSPAASGCHFIGSVRNYTKSAVAISNCRGLAGLIRADQSREFFIEPVLGLGPSEHDGKHAHVIYRRSIRGGEEKNVTEPACGVTVEDVQDRNMFEDEPREEGEGFYVRRRNKRSVSLMKHIEILLVADYSMTKYYSSRDLETYLFTIMNMKGLNVSIHARNSLNNFCRWVRKINPSSDLDPRHADAAVLVTRKDICRSSYKPCETLGLSNIDGMCSAGYECSYNQDNGFSLVYTIAHELGHNLGVLHDDDYSSCSQLREHIMASNLVIHPSEQLWSKCSKKAMKSFFYKGWGWCLNDQPGVDLQPKLPRRVLPGESFDADAQCKTLFGVKSTLCKKLDNNLCKTLWCIHSSGQCATHHFLSRKTNFPALEGTPCGKTKDQWCRKGKCVNKYTLNDPVNGGWGSWSYWSDCSRSCGRGVKRRTRKCNKPRPEHGGYYCVGEWKKHSICNAQPCPEGSDNPVQIQCKKFQALLVNGKRYVWTAKQAHTNPCELRCTPVVNSGHSGMRKFIQAQDGTPCNHGTRNICIQGKCEHVGCDDMLHSSAREDRCGVCRGDGSTCETKHDSFDQPNGTGYTNALVIPAQSRNIIIQEVSGSPNYLALRSASGDYFLNGNWYIQWSGGYDVAGTSGHYSRKHNRETFKTKGPITEDLHVMLLYQGKNTGLKAQYDVIKNQTLKLRHFHWKYTPWTSCSVTCGLGVQKRDMYCVDQESYVVDARLCKHKYRFVKKLCRRGDCPPTWWVGVWHKCSKTCGDAMKIRAVLCTQIIPNRRQIIDDKKCRGLKPAVSTVCEQPLCWTVHPWFNCTSLCGPGLQHRLVECPGHISQCDPFTKPVTNRTCVGNSCAQWRLGPWKECSASCGNGTQVRNVSCEHHDEDMCRRHAKPLTTQACHGIPCPEWKTGEWSECSVTCGKGVKTRNVTCENERVNFTCSASEKPGAVRSCLQKRCSGWTVGEWSSCSSSCGEGIRERKVVCTFKLCTPATRPKHKETCVVRHCPRWSVGEWSECSVSCGEGIQYRNITCSDPTYPCREDLKPSGFQKCFMPECSTWSFGNWSDCSVSCGSGVQTRSITCNADTPKQCLQDTPHAERPCNERPCQMWATGNWGDCSVSCGEGVQSRQVYCDHDDETLCSASEMPESTRDCFVWRCGAWIVTRWGPCSAKCGLGYARRNATCRFADSRNCSNKPSVVRMCEDIPCSKWSTGHWSPCSVTCNRGVQRRIVSCHGGRCLASSKPLSIKECVMQSCGHWIPGNWSECSVSCGVGVQMRDIRCSETDSIKCTHTKPIVKKYCNEQNCPYWSVGEWLSCSTSCGNGTQTRNITCVGGTCPISTQPKMYRPCFSGTCPQWVIGDWIPCTRSCDGGFQRRMIYCEGKTNTSCDDLVKPNSKRRCNEQPCPQWTVGNWSDCSKSCDSGLQSRQVSCKNSHVGGCSEDAKPNVTRKCAEFSCPHWVTGSWSECSKSCNNGMQTRMVSCNNSDVGACLNSTKPTGTQKCADVPCPRWSVSKWSKCSKSCNNGMQTRKVVCRNSHVGECVQGKPNTSKTCGNVPCPVWSVGRWSVCSKTCDGGIQTRAVTCKNKHIGKCLSVDEPNSSRKCAKVPCPYWSVGQWSKCSKSCADGTQIRTVTCKHVHIGRCLTLSKPNSSRKCFEAACPHWLVSPWSKCSKSCNGGSQTRTVTCNNSHVGHCLGKDKPESTKMCGDLPCPEWSVGAWSRCSKSCGIGTQTRNVLCENIQIGDCNPEIKPASNASCGGVPCPEWSVGGWSPCSKSCNGGIRYRHVTCNNSDVGECLIEEKPPLRQICGELPCPHWKFGPWRRCSKSCGGGLQRRVVFCRNTHVGDCLVEDQPRGVKRCGDFACPSWLVGEWTGCSKTCGDGIQTRNISCMNNHIGPCSEKNKPLDRQKCGIIPCPHWSVGEWSKCSKSCDGGIQTRAVTCENGHIGECSQEERPSTNQKCGRVSCPKWLAEKWSECSKSCGNGTKIRNVVCLNKHVGDCPVKSKPSSNQQCGDIPCPHWTVGMWSECSSSCNGGIKIRSVYCNNSHVGDCPVTERPVTDKTCGDIPCPKWAVTDWSKCSKSCNGGLTYRTVRCENNHVGQCLEVERPENKKSCGNASCPEWYVSEWSGCSKSCDGGVQLRAVYCNNSDVGECLAMDKPNNTKQCGEQPCPKWTVTEWSKCSKSCNVGMQTRNVICNNSYVGDCQAESKPDDIMRCGDVPCPEWSVGNWSVCSRSCGSGMQTRMVICKNIRVGNCSLDTKPTTSQKCNEALCPQWDAGPWSECSKSCGGGIRTRNITCQNRHVGECLVKEKPNATQKCSDVPCPQWALSEWSECSKSCEGGVQSRDVTCKYKHVGNCLEKDKPDTRQNCSDVPCPVWSVGKWTRCSKSCNGGVKYRRVSCMNVHIGDCLAVKPRNRKHCHRRPCPKWSVSEWSKCSRTCNGGTQTRDVICKNSNVGECLLKNKPESSQICGDAPCPEWSVGEWSKCSKTCDGGNRRRTVTCHNGHVGECLGKDKPALSQKCADVPCPVWKTGDWLPCSESCNGGVQMRTVSCVNNHIGECLPSKKPEESRSCSNIPCPEWSVSTWSKCSKSCDGGIQKRTVTCNNSHIGECLENDKPNTTNSCGEVPCPKWSVTNWSSCTKSCNVGIQTRTVTCLNSHIGDCILAHRPDSSRNCNDLPCPVWTAGPWSKCSKSCGGGVHTRTVFCKNKKIGTCIQNKKPEIIKSCGYVPCPKWSVNRWSPCSKSCDGGIQTRTVFCENIHVGNCTAADVPVAVRKCREVPCPQWSVTEWSACSKSCDGGLKTRTVTCENSHIGRCLLVNRPNETIKCGTESCPQWIAGVWSKCSKSCDGGTKFRIVTCKNNHVGKCPQTTKPTTKQECNDMPCPQWSVGQWSKCSKSCNGGIQTRTVECKNNHVGKCTENDKPEYERRCANVSCPKWSVGQWSKCSKSCNGGIQTRTVECKNNHVGKCTENDKPEYERLCANVSCPKWSVGQWSKCSKSCNGGIQTRTVECKNNHVGKCTKNDKPEYQRRCANVSCPEWSVGQWSKCSKSCNGGVQTRTVACKNSHVGKCTENDKPEYERLCANVSCPEWSVGQWSKCSKSCNGGIQTRTVECKNNHVGKCTKNDKPEYQRRCANVSCPEWSVGQWSKCSKSCNGGVQTRTVACKNSHVGKCTKNDKPEYQRRCANVSCPEWSVGQWSKCSKSCNGGVQTRTVACKNSHVGKCTENDKPEYERLCANVSCPEWSVGQWSKCSKSCNGGIQTRTVECKNNHVGKCTKNDKPEYQRRCANVSCPEWSVGQWSKCSKSCNGGVQTRTVACKNSHVGKCTENDKPENQRRCANVSCPEWSVGQWSKCSKSCNGGTQIRTVRCRNSHVGRCSNQSKPSFRQICGNMSCPKWLIGNWSECTKSCGLGKRTRMVRCSGGPVLPCKESKPVSHVGCNDFACPVWIVGNWTKCKAITGRKCPKGKRSRPVECSWKDRRACLRTSRKPVSRERCVAQCPRWKTGEWSQCQGTCSQGTMTRRVWCNGEGSWCKLREKPPGRKTCQLPSCKVWETSDWNLCPVTCGGALQRRNVHCVNRKSRDLTQGCDRRSKPTTVQACALVECPPSSDDSQPVMRTECRQAKKDEYFCTLLLRPSLSELCLYKQWRRTCCKSCLKVNAQRRKM